MIHRMHLPAAALMIAALAGAPVAQARVVHHRAHGVARMAPGHPGCCYRAGHHGGGVGAAIIGGMIGLGIGAAIASRGAYGPPPGYYGAPPPAAYGGY